MFYVLEAYFTHISLSLLISKLLCGKACVCPNGTRFARCSFRAQKSLDFKRPIPSNGRRNGFARISYSEDAEIVLYFSRDGVHLK
jgi:hypothetical protein